MVRKEVSSYSAFAKYVHPAVSLAERDKEC